MVYILLGEGFEEMEAVAPFDILKRGGVDAKFAGVNGLEVMAAHGVAYKAHCLVSEVELGDAEMVIIPGGMGGVECIEASSEAMDLVKKAYDMGIELAAICAGPRVLSKLGILKGKKAVCYPGLEDQMDAGKMTQESGTIRDELLTTSRGPGTAIDFGLKVLEVLRSREIADEVASFMHYDRR